MGCAPYYRTNPIHIVKDIKLFQKIDVEYAPFIEEHEHALKIEKQEVAFLEASLAKKKENMSPNGVSLKSIFRKLRALAKN